MKIIYHVYKIYSLQIINWKNSNHILKIAIVCNENTFASVFN